MSQTTSKLYKEYKTLADRADKRLLRLERLAAKNDEKYQNVLAYAYNKAQKAIEHWDGKKFDKPRFARKTPRTDEELAMKIKDIQEFLEMNTSTKSGIDKVYKKRADSLNEKFGTDFTWQDWARFGSRGYWDRTDGRFTYNEMIKVAKVQKQKADTIKAYNKFKKHFKTGPGNVKPSDVRKNTRMLNKEFKQLGLDNNNLLSELKDELGIENLLSSDLNLIKDTINTIFEPNKGIVMKQAEKYMNESGLSYDTMFK